MSTEPNKVIYSMVGVSKFYDKKAVLKDIYLSYVYGAKIGVIGLNGSGKSSLLRILAGVDKEFNGETVISPGHTVGFLEQEPRIDDSRTVREVVEEAVKETVALLKEFEEINAKFGEEMSNEDMDKLLARQGEVQENLDHQDPEQYQVEVQGVKNTDIFSAYTNGAPVGMPVTLAIASGSTIAKVDTIQAMLTLEAAVVDPQTRQKPQATLISTVRLNNCSQAAIGYKTSCQ